MNMLGFHLINKPNEDFESCSDCIHADDSEEICILRKCVHAIRYLYDCYEKAERKDAPNTNVGTWIYSYTDMICPVCNASFDDEIIYMCENGKMNFCPNCGSRMEREKE